MGGELAQEKRGERGKQRGRKKREKERKGTPDMLSQSIEGQQRG